jgi:hypothetical protein
MKELGITIFCANSAQAKGRVERANRTLQDRLVKDLRLNNISDIESANRYIEEFRNRYNKKFGKTPASPQDVHRKHIPEEGRLDFILCERENRRLSKNLELSFKKSIFQIKLAKGKIGYSLRKQTVQICNLPDGQIKIWYKNRFLDYKVFEPNIKTAEILSSKEINPMIDKISPITRKGNRNNICKQDIAKEIITRRLERLSPKTFINATQD